MLRIVWPLQVSAPSLSTFVFKWVPPHAAVGVGTVEGTPKDRMCAGALDAWNRELLVRINSANRVFLTPLTTLSGATAGEFCIRVCLVSSRTTSRHATHAVEDIAAACGAVSEAYQAGYPPWDFAAGRSS